MERPLGKIVAAFLALLLAAAPGTWAQSQSCVQPPPNLVSWWPGDGNANDIQDGNNGTLQNGATFAPGLVGQAFSFDGVAAFVSIPDAPNLNFSSTSSFTIEAWAFRTGVATVMHLIGKRQGCGGPPFYQMAIGPGAFPSDAFPLNVWTHAAVTYNGSTGLQQQYINGAVVVSSDASSFIGINTAPLLIGTSGTCAPFQGLIDEVTIYNRALSTSEIQAIFNAGMAGKCKAAVPTITSISPTSAVAGGAAFTLTVNGTNLDSGSMLTFNGNARVTTFVSAMQLTAVILASDIATAGSFNVTVTNPGGETSNSLSFTVLTPQQATQAIINSVNTLSSQGIVNGGQANSLLVKLQHAIARLNAGNKAAAIGNLNAFIGEVNDLLSSGILSPSQAALLISAAQSVIAAL